jgi:hypothetical protein
MPNHNIYSVDHNGKQWHAQTINDGLMGFNGDFMQIIMG